MGAAGEMPDFDIKLPLVAQLSMPLAPDNSTNGRSKTFQWKPTRRAVTTMGSNNLVVGENHLSGLNCQLYNWQTGM